VHAALRNQPRHRLDRDFVLELVAVNMPSEDYDRVFETFIGWSRFADLFSYDEETGVIALQHEEMLDAPAASG
jgi:hypothetical protein